MKKFFVVLSLLWNFEAIAEISKRYFISNNVKGTASGNNPVLKADITFQPSKARLEMSTKTFLDPVGNELVSQNEIAFESSESDTSTFTYFSEAFAAEEGDSQWLGEEQEDRHLLDIRGRKVDNSTISYWDVGAVLTKSWREYSIPFVFVKKKCTEELVINTLDQSDQPSSARLVRSCADVHVWGDFYPAKLEAEITASDLKEVSFEEYAKSYKRPLL